MTADRPAQASGQRERCDDGLNRAQASVAADLRAVLAAHGEQPEEAR